MKKVALFLFLWLVVFSVAGVVGYDCNSERCIYNRNEIQKNNIDIYGSLQSATLRCEELADDSANYPEADGFTRVGDFGWPINTGVTSKIKYADNYPNPNLFTWIERDSVVDGKAYPFISELTCIPSNGNPPRNSVPFSEREEYFFTGSSSYNTLYDGNLLADEGLSDNYLGPKRSDLTDPGDHLGLSFDTLMQICIDLGYSDVIASNYGSNVHNDLSFQSDDNDYSFYYDATDNKWITIKSGNVRTVNPSVECYNPSCTPKSCAELYLEGKNEGNYVCGNLDNGCGTPLSCGIENCVNEAGTIVSEEPPHCISSSPNKRFYNGKQVKFANSACDASNVCEIEDFIDREYDVCPESQVCYDDDGSGGDPAYCDVPPVPTSYNYWADMNGEIIITSGSPYPSEADVQLVTDGVGTAPNEEFILFDDVNNDGVYNDQRRAVISGNVWNTQAGSQNVRFLSTSGSSSNAFDVGNFVPLVPLNVDITFPRCGDLFIVNYDDTLGLDLDVEYEHSGTTNTKNLIDYFTDEVSSSDYSWDDFILNSKEVKIHIAMDNPYTYVEGTVSIGETTYQISSLDGVYNSQEGVSEIVVSHTFEQVGSVPVTVEIFDPNLPSDKVTRSINIIVVDFQSNLQDYYGVSSCIDHPIDHQRFESREVYFNGESSQAIKFDVDNRLLIVYDSDQLDFVWDFFHNGVRLPEKCIGIGSEVCNFEGSGRSDYSIGVVAVYDKRGLLSRVQKFVNKVSSFQRSFATVDKNSVRLTVSLPDSVTSPTT